MASTAVVLLAGGRATRFPNKLEHVIGGRPMVVRSFERVRAAGWPVYIAGKGSFSPETDARLDAPLLLDRHPGGGPCRAFLDACGAVNADRLFAIAADQPNVDAALLHRLASAWQDGDDAVVPEHEGRLEPLAALYARRAFLREGFALRAAGTGSMHEMIARLATRRLPCEGEHFANVNRPDELRGLNA
jgi:molybdopterin-guanine dinucleotide biosynthesis protein A